MTDYEVFEHIARISKTTAHGDVSNALKRIREILDAPSDATPESVERKALSLSNRMEKSGKDRKDE